MSATVKDGKSLPKPPAVTEAKGNEAVATSSKGGNYKGFVAGVFSGIAKLSVGYVALSGLFLYSSANGRR